MKQVIKIIISIIVFVLMIFVAFLLYFKLTSIDETILEGEKYGFKIGNSKEATYKKARELLKSQEVFILYPLDNQGYGPHKQISLSQKEYEFLKDRNNWEFYYDESFINYLKLSFENNRLVKIERYKKPFELP